MTKFVPLSVSMRRTSGSKWNAFREMIDGMPLRTGTESAPASRIFSVDVLRGLTVALMILVNDPGDWGHVYRQLDHAEWNGWTLTDLVFPTFLFLVGCSIVFSMASRLVRGDAKSKLALHVLRRSASILLLGWLLTLLPYLHFTRLRLYGVLPRIALCYLLTALFYLRTQRPRALAIVTVALLAGYWMLMRLVPVPGLGVPTHEIPLLDPDRNLAAWLDRGAMAFTQHWFHTGRLYEGTRDPEGLLSTLPSVATTLFGVLASLWLRSSQTVNRKFAGLLSSGAVCFVAGWAWSPWFPINKRLWTSSYVLLTAGLALLALGLLYWALDVKKLHTRSRLVAAATWPWQVFGSNAIAAFTLSVVLVKTLLYFHTATGAAGERLTWWGWIYRTFFARNGSTELTSVAFAVVFTLICFLPIWALWRRKIFLRL